MKKKIYLVQPTYRDANGRFLHGKRLYVGSLALPVVSATIPPDWEKEFCVEYFDPVNFDSDASVIGISCMGYEIFRGIEIADEFRKRGKVVLFGGFQPQITTEFVRPHADAIIQGNPGPKQMAGILADALEGKLQKAYAAGIDLNFPFDYSVLDKARLVFTPVLTSVGCRNHCDYCCVGSLYHGKYRLRSLRYVLEELDALSRRTRRIAFVDTNIYNNRGYLQRLCAEMIRRAYRFIWGAQSTIDIGDDQETLALLKNAGCRILYIGFETVEQANLDALHKLNQVDSYPRQIETVHNAGIRIAAFFMYGLDGDTRDTAAKMSRFIDEHNIALPMLNVLVPTPGTPMYDRLREDRRVLLQNEQDFLRNNIGYNASFTLCFYQPKHMAPAEIEEGFIDLLGRLSGYGQIIRRSLSADLPLSLFLLSSNWLFRKEYLELRKRRSACFGGPGPTPARGKHNEPQTSSY